MGRTRLATVATRSIINITPGSVAAAIDAGRHLTDRDRLLVALLAEHRVLTTEQITRVAFTSTITAQHRLTRLTARGVLARFRRCLPQGSQSWRYTLGMLGVTRLGPCLADLGVCGPVAWAVGSVGTH